MTEIQSNLAILVTIAAKSADLPEANSSLAELERLLNTAGGECFAKVIQIKDSFDPRTCIGCGKVSEISELCSTNSIDLVVFDFELSPSQIRNLEKDIGNDVRVLDRSMLILDIFALHATSGEGKLQVELAQLKYTAPRLLGHGTELSRQGGGIGTRGPGESKLETDRRHLHEKVTALEARLRELEHNRAVMRSQRDRSALPKIGIVGYTNAGKSTLLNALTGAGILAEDKLFATLDPTTRKCELPCGETVLFTDTVGFIRKLPHHLVKAFKSTLDEVAFSDVLLIVSDVTDPEVPEHLKVTEDVIAELGAGKKPRIYVYNKCDKDGEQHLVSHECMVKISAKTGEGVDTLLDTIEALLHAAKRDYTLLIPYDKQSLVNSLYNDFTVKSVDYLNEGIQIVAVLDDRGKGLFKAYIKDN